MDLITNIKNNEELKTKFFHYFDDDQLRFLFIVILLIGVILLISGVKYAILFWVIAFGLLAFLVIFIKPKQHDLIETFICQSFNGYTDLESDGCGVTLLEERTENCQIKFRNSVRNKK